MTEVPKPYSTAPATVVEAAAEVLNAQSLLAKVEQGLELARMGARGVPLTALEAMRQVALEQLGAAQAALDATMERDQLRRRNEPQAPLKVSES